MKKVLLSPWTLGFVSQALVYIAIVELIVDSYKGNEERYAMYFGMSLVGTVLGIVGIVIARRYFASLWPGGGFSVSLAGTVVGAIFSVPMGILAIAPEILQNWGL